MYAILQTSQAPFQFVWCSTGLGEYTTGTLSLLTYHLAPTNNATGGVFASINGSSSNSYTNQKGSLSYSFVKTGQTTGTITTAPPYNDSVLNTSLLVGYTNYALTITDTGNGQKYLYNNTINWGL